MATYSYLKNISKKNIQNILEKKTDYLKDFFEKKGRHGYVVVDKKKEKKTLIIAIVDFITI